MRYTKVSHYESPSCTSMEFLGSQIICTSGTTNAIPGMGWGGSYNEEPLD